MTSLKSFFYINLGLINKQPTVRRFKEHQNIKTVATLRSSLAISCLLCLERLEQSELINEGLKKITVEVDL